MCENRLGPLFKIQVLALPSGGSAGSVSEAEFLNQPLRVILMQMSVGWEPLLWIVYTSGASCESAKLHIYRVL